MHGKNKGVTLVEVLLVTTIIVVLAMIMTGAINPVAMVGRANDSKRKKDLGRIRVSFEDYFNDKNCYPTQAVIDGLMNEANCGSNTFAPWMNSWPCDPISNEPYYIVVSDGGNCPVWYKIYTNLENKKDAGIPSGWYDIPDNFLFGDGSMTTMDANFGTSSTNVNWYDWELPDHCDGACQVFAGGSGCNASDGCSEGERCYVFSSIYGNCFAGCRVISCP